MSSVDWNKRFIEFTEYISKWSKDKNTGVGAAIVDSDNRIVSVGYNGFPSGLNDKIDSRHERPAKYLYTEHAERNAIYNAARIGVKTKDCKMFLMWFPCPDCARAIIQCGITELICKKPDFTDKRWGDGFKVSLEMLEECKLKITYYG